MKAPTDKGLTATSPLRNDRMAAVLGVARGVSHRDGKRECMANGDRAQIADGAAPEVVEQATSPPTAADGARGTGRGAARLPT